MPSPTAPMALLLGLSLFAHVGGLLYLSSVQIDRPAPKTVVEVKRYTPPKAPPPPPPPPPPTPEAPPPPSAPKAPAPKAPAPPAPPAPAAPPAPDFGLALGNASGGPGGIAVPVGTPGGSPVREQSRELSAPAAASASTGCSEADVKARAIEMPHPAYTEEARAAGIEGKVRVELTLDAAGTVTAATVLQGLGHGLDEAAVQAVRGARFAPATRCGQPIATTFTVAVRFTL